MPQVYFSFGPSLTSIERPRCSHCTSRMMLARISLGPMGFEHRRFECPKFIGSWLLPKLGIHLGAGIISAIVNATIGAVVLLLIIRLVRGGTGWGRRW